MPAKAKQRKGPIEIRVVEATVTSQPLRGREVKVVYGKVMPDFFGEEYVTVPDFQRMEMDGDKQDELVDAFGPGGKGVPNDTSILVDDDHEVVSLGAGEVLIRAAIFHLVDGHQRFAAARERLARGQSTHPMLIKFILGLTLEEQLSVFSQINRDQTPVSIHVHMRNIHNITVAVELRKMARETPGFPRLKLDQRKHGGEEITVRMLYEVAALLHGYRPGEPDEVLDALEDLTKHIGVSQIIENTKTFFEALKACFTGNVYDNKGNDLGPHPLTRYIYRRHMLGGLALLFAWHKDFWDKRKPTKLFVSKGNIKKLRGVAHRSIELALETASARRAVNERLQYHINGQRDKHPLTPWTPPWRSIELVTPTLAGDAGKEETTDGAEA